MNQLTKHNKEVITFKLKTKLLYMYMASQTLKCGLRK
jgi:hypothetical protein